MDFNNLSDELKERAIACETPEDMLALASEEGYELSEEELEGVSGGGLWSCSDYCSDGPCSAVCGPGCGIVDNSNSLLPLALM